MKLTWKDFLKVHRKMKMTNALKVADSSSSEDSKEKSDDSDDEAMLSRKLQRILAKKKKFGSKRFFKKDKKKEPTCYKCNQPGHYKSKCLKLKKKNQAERSEKKKGKEKKFRRYKKKAMAAAWDNEEATSSDSSSSESEEEEKTNLALMAGLDKVNSETSFTSCSKSDSDNKAKTFLKNEAERLGQSLNETKRANELLCEDLKNKNSKIMEIESNLKELKDEEKLKEENDYLRATIEKISNCKTSLFLRLKGSRTGKKKYGVGYTPPLNEEDIVHPKIYPTPQFVKEKGIKNLKKVNQYVYRQKQKFNSTTHMKNTFDLCCISSKGLVTGFVKGTKVTVSEEILVELLDCPNSGHKLSEIVPLDKQKMGIIRSLGTVSKKGLLVNELSAEKRIIHSIITNIITPRAGTHSSITARDGSLLFWAIQRHRVNLPSVILEKMVASRNLQESLPYGPLLTLIFKIFSVHLSGEISVGVKVKIELSTLRRSHYHLESKAQNLWVKDFVPQCTHEIFPNEAQSLNKKKLEKKPLLKTNRNNSKKKSIKIFNKNKNLFSKSKFLPHLLSIIHLKRPSIKCSET
ncbi:hypothetical protein Taro_028177, partial [Colocasia esculenta]|nr:hypothetical protein [Colocasia esculenta]